MQYPQFFGLGLLQKSPPSDGLLYHKKISGRNSVRVTRPCVAFSILSDSSGEAFRLPFMIRESHVGEIFRCSAISSFDPRGSVEKYSVNVIRYSKKVVGSSHKAVCLNSKTLKGYCCSGANPPTPPTRLGTVSKHIRSDGSTTVCKPFNRSIPMRVGWGFTPHCPFYSAGVTYLGATQPHSVFEHYIVT